MINALLIGRDGSVRLEMVEPDARGMQPGQVFTIDPVKFPVSAHVGPTAQEIHKRCFSWADRYHGLVVYVEET